MLDLPAEAVRVAEGALDLRALIGSKVADVSLAGEHGRPDGLRLGVSTGAPVGVQVVQHPGGRLAEQPVGMGERVGEVRGDRRGIRVRVEPVQRVAELLLRLAHLGGAADPAEGVEGHRRPVPVRVADQARRQHPVVVAAGDQLAVGVSLADRDQVAERVPGLRHQQVVAVIRDGRGVVERVAEPARQEEVPPGVGELGVRIVAVIRGVEHPARGEPPGLTVPDIAGGGEHPGVHPVPVQVGDQAVGERLAVAPVRQRERLQDTERKRAGQVVAPVADPGAGDQPPGGRGQLGPARIPVLEGQVGMDAGQPVAQLGEAEQAAGAALALIWSVPRWAEADDLERASSRRASGCGERPAVPPGWCSRSRCRSASASAGPPGHRRGAPDRGTGGRRRPTPSAAGCRSRPRRAPGRG